MKLSLIFLIILTSCRMSVAQSRWELFGGIGYSNVHTYWENTQLLHVEPYKAPNFLVTYHGGVNFNIFSNKYYVFRTGIGYFQRGTLDYATFGNGENYAPRLAYIRLPISFDYRLLNGKEFFLSGGITPSYLVRNIGKNSFHQKAFSYNYYYQLDYEIGFRFPLYKHFAGKLNFTKGIFELDDRDKYIEYQSLPVPKGVEKNYNLSFDFSLIYKF